MFLCPERNITRASYIESDTNRKISTQFVAKNSQNYSTEGQTDLSQNTLADDLNISQWIYKQRNTKRLRGEPQKTCKARPTK